MASPFLKGKKQLRNVQWGAQFLWDIRFPTAPAPFKNWFPAVDVEEQMFSLNMKQFELGMTVASVPIGTESLELKITFNDDVTLAIHNWITHWVRREILNGGQAISPLDRCCKLVQLAKLDFQRRPISTQTFWVVPRGTMYFNGSSQAQVPQNSLEFTIVGVANSTLGYDASPGLFKNFKFGSGGGGFGGIFGALGSFTGIQGLGDFGSKLDTAIEIGKEAYNTYKEVRDTYEDIVNTVQEVKETAKQVVNNFKNIRSIDDAANALDYAVNSYNATLDKAEGITNSGIANYDSVKATGNSIKRKFDSLF